jgi:hypothetical protein
MADVTTWLIERADPVNPGSVMPNSFLGIIGRFDGVRGTGTFQWVDNTQDALQFVRQKDAAMFIGAVMILQDLILHGSTLPGLRSGDPVAITIEHSWQSMSA